MAENKLQPLYRTKPNASVSRYECYCVATGWDCERATKHFQEYRDFVKRMSETQNSGIFFTCEENLCTKGAVCPVWDLWVKANQNNKQKS